MATIKLSRCTCVVGSGVICPYTVCVHVKWTYVCYIYIYIRLLAVQLTSVRVAHYRPNHVYETLICIAKIFQVFPYPLYPAEHRYSSRQDSPTLSSIPPPTPSPSTNHITSMPLSTTASTGTYSCTSRGRNGANTPLHSCGNYLCMTEHITTGSLLNKQSTNKP